MLCRLLALGLSSREDLRGQKRVTQSHCHSGNQIFLPSSEKNLTISLVPSKASLIKGFQLSNELQYMKGKLNIPVKDASLKKMSTIVGLHWIHFYYITK